MKHPEVRTIAEEALKELMARPRRYCLNYARTYVCQIARCEEEDGGMYWRIEITDGSDPEFDQDMYKLMEPKMHGERFEVQTEW